MSAFHTKEYIIDTTHVDQQNILRPSVLLNFFQDMATEHAEIMGLSRDYLTEGFNACWIVVRSWFRLTSPLRLGDRLTIKTWHRGAAPLIVYRDFDLFVGEKQVGEAVAAWVVADVESRKMLRPTNIPGIVSSPVPESVKDVQLKPIRRPADLEKVYERTVRYSDLDLNGHMNNTRYADLIMDAFSPEEFAGNYISEMQLNYSQECRWGETLEIVRKTEGDFCYIDGCCGDGKRRFEATIQFSKES